MARGTAKFAPIRAVGVGINATDSIIRLPRFPVLDSKVEVLSSSVKPGGQVASAMVACRRWGLPAAYVGKVGDDAAGKFQIAEMKREGVKAHWIVAKGSASQTAYILVDETSGERTILWQRDRAMALQPKDVKLAWLANARVLLVDGHDTAAASRAARWARERGSLVVADLDDAYPKVEALLEFVDFPVMSKDFPERLTRKSDLLKSLPMLHARFKCRATIATLGRLGAVAWNGAEFTLCRGFQVDAVDTTGAGDIFHGAFVFALTRDWRLPEILDFACAAAAINCTAVGARGRIGTLREIMALRRRGQRSEVAWSRAELAQAARRAEEGARADRSASASAPLIIEAAT